MINPRERGYHLCRKLSRGNLSYTFFLEGGDGGNPRNGGDRKIYPRYDICMCYVWEGEECEASNFFSIPLCPLPWRRTKKCGGRYNLLNVISPLLSKILQLLGRLSDQIGADVPLQLHASQPLLVHRSRFSEHLLRRFFPLVHRI